MYVFMYISDALSQLENEMHGVYLSMFAHHITIFVEGYARVVELITVSLCIVTNMSVKVGMRIHTRGFQHKNAWHIIRRTRRIYTMLGLHVPGKEPPMRNTPWSLHIHEAYRSFSQSICVGFLSVHVRFCTYVQELIIPLHVDELWPRLRQVQDTTRHKVIMRMLKTDLAADESMKAVSESPLVTSSAYSGKYLVPYGELKHS